LSRDNDASPVPALQRAWSRARADAYFTARTGVADPVEGFWYDAIGPLAVVHDAALAPAQYVAVRVDGEAAGTPVALVTRHDDGYRIDYRHAQWGWQSTDAGLHRGGDLLAFDTHGWGRAGAARLDPKDPMAPLFADLGDGVVYLSMPSFMGQYREPVQQIIAGHGDAL